MQHHGEEKEREIKYYVTLKFVVTFQRFLFWQAVQYKNQRTEVQLECHGGSELPRRSGGKWKLLIVAIVACLILFCSIMPFVTVKRR